MKTNHLLFIALLCYFQLPLFAQLSIEDHLGMENINQPQVFDGQLIYAHTIKENWKGRTTSSILHLDPGTQSIRPLTEHEYDYDPKWSPNGQWISFISYRNNLQQIYIIPNQGGKPKMVSDAQYYLSNYQWQNETTIAYVDDEPKDSLIAAADAENGGGYIVGTEFFTNAIWSYDINTGEKNKLTSGKERIIDFRFSKDGRYLAMLGAKNYDTYESITNSWIKVIDLNNQQEIYRFSGANSLNQLAFSPSGKYIAFTGSTIGYACNDGLFVANLKNGKEKNLTYDLDPTIEKIAWIDNKRLAFSSVKGAHTAIYQTDLKGKTTTILPPDWVIYDFQLSQEDLFFTASQQTKPLQLYQVQLGAKLADATQLSQLNSELNPKLKTHTQVVNYQSKDGTAVQGLLTYPIDYDDSHTYPLMTIPHGGPDALVKNDFGWMKQFFADQGYLVFQPNFRGSIGYGRDFYTGNRNAFGQTDFADIMAGIDYLITEGIASEDQLVIGGWSYGGYMANWAITQTDRFKAAISIAGMANLVSMYGQHEFSNREIGMWEYRHLLIDNPEAYRKASPIFQVKKAETPLLILHGANDTRSPTLQAWEMYRAMQDAKKTVKMMIYPRAGHSISNPVQRKSVLNQWLQWSDDHLGRNN
ncbi:MAG: S9 family peptidase [Saprospiraceae bacterium]